ncbi:MAG: NADH-quinone oxidoreductase subunit K [Ilumatobacteraceae bacterium]|nr:NADH-quinone oxidoreductase subunit K [Ilumatobacteraceae bacterium]
MSLALAAVTAILFAAGTWLLLQRRLTRIIIGIGLLGHGANLLLVTSGGRAGSPPVIDGSAGSPAEYSDPLPQALALTAIVITFGVTAFLLALGYRSWQINRDDKVEDDLEDRIVARLNELDGPEGPIDDGDPDTNEFEVEEDAQP